MSLKGKNIIVGICGGIAAYKACSIIRALSKLGANVECVLTQAGANFITPLTLRTLSKNKVHSGMFENPQDWEAKHISLAKKADLILIAPATAETISKLARGAAGDLLSSTVLASKAKVLVCPAMNSNMLSHPATQNNLKILQSYGYKIVNSQEGELACGISGPGRLAETSVIVEAVEKEI